MTMTIAFAALWVIASTIVAFLPMYHQIRPGILLMAAAPFLIALLGMDYGPLVAGLATVAFLSMYRNPLVYFWARLRDARGGAK
ncbi:MAG: DUF2484 family protein [Marinibacterium sp.]